MTTNISLSSRARHLRAMMSAGVDLPPASEAPADPFALLAEKCRKQFLRDWHEQHGDSDAIDTATEVYGS